MWAHFLRDFVRGIVQGAGIALGIAAIYLALQFL